MKAHNIPEITNLLKEKVQIDALLGAKEPLRGTLVVTLSEADAKRFENEQFNNRNPGDSPIGAKATIPFDEIPEWVFEMFRARRVITSGRLAELGVTV